MTEEQYESIKISGKRNRDVVSSHSNEKLKRLTKDVNETCNEWMVRSLCR